MGPDAGGGGVNKRALIIDVAKCINCSNCVLATKDEHVGNDFPGYAAPQPAHGHEWISIEQRARGSGTQVDVAYIPKMCNHCDDAPCIKAAGDGSVYKRADGIVIIDPAKARGRKDLVAACPYGSIAWNEEANVPQIWIFDAHLLDGGWQEPRCVQACPTGAMESFNGPDQALDERRARERLEGLRPDLDTRPRVLYRNLRRSRLCFVGGNVFRQGAGGRAENVEGAAVELVIDGEADRSAVTDCFGDFRVDDLRVSGAKFKLRVRHKEFGRAETSGILSASENLGSIELSG